MYVIKICQHPGMTQDQFQACSYLNPSNITRSIATLEKEGFIIRKVSEQDKRTMASCILTQKGERCL